MTAQTLAEMRNELIEHGYIEIDEFRGLRAGARVHHRNEQYWQAYAHGTATVRAVFLKDPSPWSRKWGRPDVELIVERDKPLLAGMGLLYGWAEYHTALVEAGR